MKKVLSLLAVVFVFANCATKVNPNEWVVSTATCWNTMTVSKAGDYVPRVYSTCDRMVILPATELSADFTCETKFQQRVAGKVSMTYQWKITDPIAFIQSAKSIQSSSTDEQHRINTDALEQIENSVVDKMLIDLIREYTPSKEAGIDEKQVETDLMDLCRLKFANRGVTLFNPSVNINFSQQTETALDVISALKFYQANNEIELGRDVIKAKAGATTIVVENKTQTVTPQE